MTIGASGCKDSKSMVEGSIRHISELSNILNWLFKRQWGLMFSRSSIRTTCPADLTVDQQRGRHCCGAEGRSYMMHMVLSGASEGIMASLIPDPLIFDQSDKGRQGRQGYPGESFSSSPGFYVFLFAFQ